MGDFNSDDHYIYYSGQESLRRNGVAIIVNKRVQNAVLGCNLKNDKMLSVRFQGKLFNITVIQVCAPTSNAEAKVELFYEDLQNLLELSLKMFFSLSGVISPVISSSTYQPAEFIFQCHTFLPFHLFVGFSRQGH